MTTEQKWLQADRYADIATRAKSNQVQYSFNVVGRALWKDIERAARRLRVELIDSANADMAAYSRRNGEGF